MSFGKHITEWMVYQTQVTVYVGLNFHRIGYIKQIFLFPHYVKSHSRKRKTAPFYSTLNLMFIHYKRRKSNNIPRLRSSSQGSTARRRTPADSGSGSGLQSCFMPMIGAMSLKLARIFPRRRVLDPEEEQAEDLNAAAISLSYASRVGYKSRARGGGGGPPSV